MKKAFQTRVLVVVLGIATLAACVLAGLNFAAESSYVVPTDGVTWVDAPGDLLCAEHVPDASPGRFAGIQGGDLLQGVDDQRVGRLSTFERLLFADGVYGKATYSIVRPMGARTHCNAAAATGPASRLDIQVILAPVDRSINYGLRLIAVAYLLIGLYVLFRRWTAPKSTHFFVFCLVSFVLYAFKYTGQLDTFDQVIYWSNIVATCLQPALFLHFALTFSGSAPDPRVRSRRRLWATLLYLPGLFLIGLQVTALERWSPTQMLLHRLDKIAYGYMALFYVWAAVVFYIRGRRAASSPLERQQLKWLTRGTLVAVVPFTVLYVVPFLTDRTVPAFVADLVQLSLVFLPLTFAWAIVRYRLMDVDLIFKRGVTYTLTTAAIAGIYFGGVALFAELIHTQFKGLGSWGLLLALIVAGLTFDPLKRAIQARVDRVFDRKRFDYREALIEFGRSLNSQTDLRELVDAIVERLPQTLLVARVAVFLAGDADGGRAPASNVSGLNVSGVNVSGLNVSGLNVSGCKVPGFELAGSHGLTNLDSSELTALDVSFLEFDGPDANSHVFLENPQHVLRLADRPAERETAAQLDLNYYLPCRVANRAGPGARTVAIIGLGRTSHGDFLSSEDMEVLESLAGYIGIAIQNAQLYRRLESKINEFERLKDFNQNIVESINIGIFAVDLDDRIESWNSQMEVLFARPRSEAIGVQLAEILPPDFMARFDSVRAEHGTHTLYKFRLPLPTGETRTANIAIAPLVTRDFRIVGRTILVDDITNRMELEAQLTQSEKLSSIGLLAAGVAHEVNTPLAVISSYTQMLTKQVRNDAALAKRLDPVLEKITQQTFRASEIVNGLLNFSRTSTVEFTHIDMNQLLHDSAILLEHQFKTARISIVQDLSPTLALVQGNQGKLQQVLLNLMLNAKDAMGGAGGTVRLHSATNAGKVVVEVSDSGSGIAAENLHRVFDPFFTTKTNPKAGEHKGTGLGLAVSYGILQEHGGLIKVESTPGVGSTFRLEIPALASSAVPTEPYPKAESLAGKSL